MIKLSPMARLDREIKLATMLLRNSRKIPDTVTLIVRPLCETQPVKVWRLDKQRAHNLPRYIDQEGNLYKVYKEEDTLTFVSVSVWDDTTAEYCADMIGALNLKLKKAGMVK